VLQPAARPSRDLADADPAVADLKKQLAVGAGKANGEASALGMANGIVDGLLGNAEQRDAHGMTEPVGCTAGMVKELVFDRLPAVAHRTLEVVLDRIGKTEKLQHRRARLLDDLPQVLHRVLQAT